MSNHKMKQCTRGVRISDGKCKRKPGPKPKTNKRKPTLNDIINGGGGFGYHKPNGGGYGGLSPVNYSMY